ncbi:hypothetical protein AMTRI_Chr11g93610 [Amborella trichopoda]
MIILDLLERLENNYLNVYLSLFERLFERLEETNNQPLSECLFERWRLIINTILVVIRDMNDKQLHFTNFLMLSYKFILDDILYIFILDHQSCYIYRYPHIISTVTSPYPHIISTVTSPYPHIISTVLIYYYPHIISYCNIPHNFCYIPI